MADQTLYTTCPLCTQAPVLQQDDGSYRCQNCGLTLAERAFLGLFKRGKFGIEKLPEGYYSLAKESLTSITLPPDALKVVIGNIYTDQELADIAGGNVDAITPVQTVLAQIILEQLREACFINVNGLRRGHGPPLTEESSYRPTQKASLQNMAWQDRGNLFCTTHRLVLPSDQFTFIRLDRKVSGVQAFKNGVAVQRKREEYATYFIGCYPHEAALVAAYVMARVPVLRPASLKN